MGRKAAHRAATACTFASCSCSKRSSISAASLRLASQLSLPLVSSRAWRAADSSITATPALLFCCPLPLLLPLCFCTSIQAIHLVRRPTHQGAGFAGTLFVHGIGGRSDTARSCRRLTRRLVVLQVGNDPPLKLAQLVQLLIFMRNGFRPLGLSMGCTAAVRLAIIESAYWSQGVAVGASSPQQLPHLWR